MPIKKKIFAGMACLVVLLALGGGMSAFLTMGLASAFGEYRSTARASLLVNDVAKDVFEARIAGLKYRATGDSAVVEELQSNIAEVREVQDELAAEAAGTNFADDVAGMPAKFEAYEANFLSAVTLQGERNTLVEELAGTGQKAREQLSNIMETAFEDNDPTAAYAAGLTVADLLLGRLYIERYLVTNEQNDFNTSKDWLTSARDRLDELLKELQNPVQRSLAETTIGDLEQFIETSASVAEVIARRNEFYATMDAIGPDLLNDVESIIDYIVVRQNTLGPALTARASATVLIVIGIAALGAVIGAVFAFFIGRSISRPIDAITNDISDMAEGNLDIEIYGQDDEHEIGKMAKAMEVFRKTALKARELADVANAAQEVERQRAAQSEQRRQHERRIVTQVSQSAGAVSTTAAEFEATATEMAIRSEKTATALEGTSSEVETLLTSVQGVVRNAEKVDQSMQSVRSGAEYGRTVADTTKGAMQKMAEASALIESVITVIEDIAFQINLLSLNAGVEAARAGEAGRGFTVVAAEVRALAQRSQDAVSEINQVIAENGKSVEASVEQVSKSQAALETIINDVAIASAQIEDITQAVTEQSTGIDRINSSILSVRDAAHSDAASIEELSASSVSLSDEAKNLHGTISELTDEETTEGDTDASDLAA